MGTHENLLEAVDGLLEIGRQKVVMQTALKLVANSDDSATVEQLRSIAQQALAQSRPAGEHKPKDADA